MPTYNTSKHVIDIRQDHGLGSNWVVKVYRTRFLFKKCLSSDWFLDAVQAQKFVDELRLSLERPETTGLLAGRKPGWVLRRPAH
jgi:hypothetical protein